MKKLLLATEYSTFMQECSQLPLSDCDLEKLGKPIPHWLVTRGSPKMSRLNNFRIRLLVGCHGLEADVCRFTSNVTRDPTCKLCTLEPEDPAHFIYRCPALSPFRDLSIFPPDLQSSFCSDPSAFVDIMLGINWIDDLPLQRSIICFLTALRDGRNSLLTSAH